MLASRERRETHTPLTSTVHWFETEVLAGEWNYRRLARLHADLLLLQREAARPRESYRVRSVIRSRARG